MRTAVLLVVFSAACYSVEALTAEKAVRDAKEHLLDRHLQSAVSSVHSGQAGINKPALNPSPTGHMLTDTELNPIENVACLEAKQADPTVNCSKRAPLGMEGGRAPGTNAPLNAGNFPVWKDPRCYGNGEYFCDPDRLLTTAEREQLVAQMKKLRSEQHITCGPQLQHDPIDKWHYQPFYLGVAIAKDWPQHESDSASLQSFGRILAGRWNMTYPWDGNPSFYARCPNEAMLIILPQKRQAHLSSPSCMFLCEEKGGPEVATATILGLDSHGLMAGVSAGMTEVYKAIAQSSPMHKPGWQPVEKTAGTWSFKKAAAGKAVIAEPSATLEENIWDWTQRVLFAIAVAILAASIVVALLVCYLAPGAIKELNKSVV